MKKVFVVLTLFVLAIAGVAATTNIDLPARLAQLEKAVFGGANVSGTAALTVVSTTPTADQAITGTYKLTNAGGYAGPQIDPQTVINADGAISIKMGTVIITKGSAAALTLAAPTATTDDGKILRIVSTTGYAHTVTNSTPGFNNGSTASDVGTFGAAAGNGLVLEAYNGVWYVIGNIGVTLA